MKQSHKVQSTRVIVEQTIADLKRAKIMTGNKIKTAADFEKKLDCVIALHNLEVLLKADPAFDFPARRAAIPGKDVQLNIPKDPPNLDAAEYRHIRDFKDFLPSAAGAMKRAMELDGKDAIFFPTVRERGLNLYKGAYVLHLQVQHEGLGLWTVKYLVGALYSYETHTGYFQMSRDNAVVQNICDCYSG